MDFYGERAVNEKCIRFAAIGSIVQFLEPLALANRVVSGTMHIHDDGNTLIDYVVSVNNWMTKAGLIFKVKSWSVLGHTMRSGRW